MLFGLCHSSASNSSASPGPIAVQVRAVRLRRDRIVVALEHKVLTYKFQDLKLLHQIETLGNSRGLLALSSAADSTVLACPGLHTGQVLPATTATASTAPVKATAVAVLGVQACSPAHSHPT